MGYMKGYMYKVDPKRLIIILHGNVFLGKGMIPSAAW